MFRIPLRLLFGSGFLLAILSPVPSHAAPCTRDASGSDPAAMEAACTPIITDPKTSSVHKADTYGFRGYGRYRQGNFKGAIADFDEGLRLAPKHARLLRQRAAAYRDQGDFKNALIDALAAVAIDPKDPASFVIVAGSQFALGDQDGAYLNTSRVLALEPNNAWARNLHAAIALAQFKHEEALKDTSLLMTLPRANLQDKVRSALCQCLMDGWLAARLQHGTVLGRLDRAPEAEAIMNDLVAKDPSGNNHFGRALLFKYLPRTMDGPDRSTVILSDFREATRLLPEYFYAWNGLAAASLSEGHFAASLEASDNAMRVMKEEDYAVERLPEMLWWRAQALRGLNQLDQAKATAQEALLFGMQVTPQFAHRIFDRLRSFGYWQNPRLPEVADEQLERAVAACMLDKQCW